MMVDENNLNDVSKISEASVGKTIRELRNTLGLSQEEFATKLGTTQEMIAKLEGNLHKPSYRTLQKIIDIFRVDPKIFFLSS